MENEWNTAEVLRQVRHDWLNKLQLIKGNLDLGKIDRAKEIIGEIVIETQNETKVTNLNLPYFTVLLLTHNWKSTSFQLEFEVIDGLKCKGLDDKALANWTRKFFTCLSEAAKLYADNHLFLTIEPQEEGLRFFFDFCGIIEEKESIEQFLQNSTSFGMIVNQFEISELELTLEVFISYK